MAASGTAFGPSTAPDDVVPDYPRLHPGVSIFADGASVIIRSVHGAFRIEPVHRAAMLRVMEKLDGANSLVTLLGHERTADAFYILRMLGWFAQCGMLSGSGAGTGAEASRQLDTTGRRLKGASLVFRPGDRLTDALLSRMSVAGAAVCHGEVDDAAAADAVHLVCPDGPDLGVLEAINRAAVQARVSWLPVFPFGDAVVIGPLVPAGGGPCLRCFELRWLGISPSIALERAYLDHLRGGGWLQESHLTIEEADKVSDLASAVWPRRRIARRDVERRRGTQQPW